MNLGFFIFNYFPFGGLERNFLRITESCMARGHQVDVFTMSWTGERPDGVNLITVPHQGLTNHGQARSFVKNLPIALQDRPHDLRVGFNRMPGLDLYYAADVCYVLDISRRRGILSRLTPRYRLLAAFERAVFAPESDTHIMYLSETEKNNYMTVYQTPEERFHFLPPGINRSLIETRNRSEAALQLRRRYNLHPGDKIMLMVGSDFVRKGVPRAIRALASLPPDLRTRTRLFVVGRGKQGPMMRLAKKLKIIDNIHFTGPREDVPFFLAGADLLLHPAITENTGNAILEALAAGLPVLVTGVCGYAFHVEKAGAGKIISGAPFDQAQMDKTVRRMLESGSREEWRANALAYARDTDLYSRPQAAVRIIEDLAKKR